MFTGIIEALGTVKQVLQHGTNRTFWLRSSISGQLKVDQSLSHNGVCLTVEEITGDSHCVTAVQETLNKTSIGLWNTGDIINLERCLPLNGRLDGHLVQGHVDATAILEKVIDMSGSWQFTFDYPSEFAALVIEKGSISLNGISLTIFNVTNSKFSVAIIPFTHEHTNIKTLKPGDMVNLEFDMMGKYVNRIMQLKVDTEVV